MNYKIAVITPKYKNDYMTDTVLDGLVSLKIENPELMFFLPDSYQTDLDIKEFTLNRGEFLTSAKKADLIIFLWGKGNTDYELTEEVDDFSKTVFVDGSEVGRNRRFDIEIEKQILDGSYEGEGKIEKEMLERCALYFRREKPYIKGILPLPFGIERKYSKYYSRDTNKDIDFFCVFGQEEYPQMRREAREEIIYFCQKNGFSFFADKTPEDNFYRTLSRSKVGISIGGGGYDTARFWEILGNNCLLLTEKIDIYEQDSKRLDYKRIWQFGDIAEFKSRLASIGDFLRGGYNQENLREEYEKIMEEHSSKSRVMEIISNARKINLIK